MSQEGIPYSRLDGQNEQVQSIKVERSKKRVVLNTNWVDAYSQSSGKRTSAEADMGEEPFHIGVQQHLSTDSPLRTPLLNPRQTASGYSCTLNLMNTMVGAGILALPYAFSKMGLVIGAGVMALSATGTMFCLHILSVHTLVLRNPSYSKLATLTMPRFKILVDFAIALMCFGNAIGYLCLIGDNIPDAISGIFPDSEGFVISRRFWIVLLVVTVILPFSSLKNLHSFRHISTFSMLIIAYLTLTVSLYAIKPAAYFRNAKMECPDGKWYIGIPPGIGVMDILREVPLFVFGFTCHQNILSLCTEAKVQKQSEFNRIIYCGVGGAAVIYSAFALTGFYLIGTNLKADIITCLPKTSALADVCRFGIALNMAFSIPLQIHPSRDSLTSMLFGSGVRAKDLPACTYYVMTFALMATATGIAMIVTSIDEVFGLVGAVCGVFICYILPGFFFWKLMKKTRAKVRQVLSILVIVFGVFTLPLFVALQLI